MITEDYVSFDTAKLLKEKGFGQLTYACFAPDGEEYYGYRAVDDDIMRPTLQMAMKWLRESHHIVLVVDYDYECADSSYCYKVYCLGENGKPKRVPIYGVGYDIEGNQFIDIVSYRDYERSPFEYAKYEEACEDAIKYCLENLIQ